MVWAALALPSVIPLDVTEVGVMKLPTGALGLPSAVVAAFWLVRISAPATTTTAMTTAMTVYSISEPVPPPEPRVLARARDRFASRLARRCCRAERRLVGGTLLPEEWRPLGRLEVIAKPSCVGV